MLEIIDVTADAWRHVCVKDRGDGPLVLAIYGQHVGRQGNGHLRKFSEQDFPSALLIGWIGVGVQKGDGYGGDPSLGEKLSCPNHFHFVQCQQDFTLESGALVDLQAISWLHGTFRLDPRIGIGQSGSTVPRDLKDVLVPGGDQQANLSALVFQHGIGGDGRTVQDVNHVRWFNFFHVQDIGQSLEESYRWIFRSGRSFIHRL